MKNNTSLMNIFRNKINYENIWVRKKFYETGHQPFKVIC